MLITLETIILYDTSNNINRRMIVALVKLSFLFITIEYCLFYSKLLRTSNLHLEELEYIIKNMEAAGTN